MRIFKNMVVIGYEGKSSAEYLNKIFGKVIVMRNGTALFLYPTSAPDGMSYGFEMGDIKCKKPFLKKEVTIWNDKEVFHLYPATQDEIDKALYQDKVKRATEYLRKDIGDDVNYLVSDDIISMAEARGWK